MFTGEGLSTLEPFKRYGKQVHESLIWYQKLCASCLKHMLGTKEGFQDIFIKETYLAHIYSTITDTNCTSGTVRFCTDSNT